MEAGPHEFVWDGRDDAGSRVPVGNYYARLTVGGRDGTQRLLRKLTLLR